jgi:putative phosphoribosyl transferase
MNNLHRVYGNGDAIKVPINNEFIEGNFNFISKSQKMVIFAHGSGSGRRSPRNKYVSRILNECGISTLLVDLLTENEERIDDITAEYRFNIPLLADRLTLVTQFILDYHHNQKVKAKEIGYFGASTGAAAALIAAEKMKNVVKAVVSRGGRVDLAHKFVSTENIVCPILFIVGENDEHVIRWNQYVLENQIPNVKYKQIIIIPGASHLFEEPGKLEEVAKYAAEWFTKYL